MHLPTRILVPVTFDSAGRAALRAASELAKLGGAQLRLIHVWDAPFAAQHIETPNVASVDGTLFERVRHECAVQLQQFVGTCGVDVGARNLSWTIHSGNAATEILAAIALEECDWVVMGTHQRQGLAHWLNGSVAEEVLRHASCPVLIVPSSSEDQ